MEKPREKPIRVLVVDDSAIVRKGISEIINADRDCEVIATAGNSQQTLALLANLSPDVITLDIQLYGENGLDLLSRIMETRPTPVVIVSAFAGYNNNLGIEALQRGALEIVTKPGGPTAPNFSTMAQELILKIKAAAAVDESRLGSWAIRPGIKSTPALLPARQLVVIGASTGGPRALSKLLPQLNPNLPASVVIAQHMPVGFTKPLAERLNTVSKINVKEAEDREVLYENWVYLAPGGRNIQIVPCAKGGAVKIFSEQPVELVTPCIDRLMRSACEVFKDRVIGVLLTGMGEDGTKGMLTIKEEGGITIAEAETTCSVFGMPKSAISSGAVMEILPLDEIAQRINQLTARK